MTIQSQTLMVFKLQDRIGYDLRYRKITIHHMMKLMWLWLKRLFCLI